MGKRPLTLAVLLATAALLLAGPALAYTIYLKDGTSIQAKEKYKVSGGRAIIVLLNGTQSFLDAKEIDVRRTEEANRVDYGGNAIVLKTPQGPAAPPPPPERTLSDLIASRSAGPRDLPGARRADHNGTSTPSRTPAGYVDLTSLARKPYPQLDVAAELQQFLRSQGLADVEIYQGSQPDRPLLDVTAASEGAVFQALSVAANALLHVRETHPKVSAFELFLATPTRERAGQFVLTPEHAASLAAKSVEVATFFVQNVQF